MFQLSSHDWEFQQFMNIVYVPPSAQPISVHRWSTVCDAIPAVNQHWVNVCMVFGGWYDICRVYGVEIIPDK